MGSSIGNARALFTSRASNRLGQSADRRLRLRDNDRSKWVCVGDSGRSVVEEITVVEGCSRRRRYIGSNSYV